MELWTAQSEVGAQFTDSVDGVCFLAASTAPLLLVVVVFVLSCRVGRAAVRPGVPFPFLKGQENTNSQPSRPDGDSTQHFTKQASITRNYSEKPPNTACIKL